MLRQPASAPRARDAPQWLGERRGRNGECLRRAQVGLFGSLVGGVREIDRQLLYSAAWLDDPRPQTGRLMCRARARSRSAAWCLCRSPPGATADRCSDAGRTEPVMALRPEP